ncbi:glycosyltransferase family 4 protein [Amycolatopsis albispora]|uniref:Glycosyl transferase family 1 n=1 Tax=Amycolatopsis albispora TaxID=1804986 RepID=A0A344LD54_9PSEU|nr:glycosyltransferase family 4 protein [Amycolatopsis albispora]AXB45978.1 glycosyl transferase family 1 [Amycolatopsis albispora]
MSDGPRVHFELDHPPAEFVVPGDVLPVSGWALMDGFAPSFAEVLVDGAAPVSARIRIPRADVAAGFPDFGEAGTCGFEARVALDLPPGAEHRVSLRVRLRHHEVGEWTSPARYCTVRNPARDTDDEQLAAALRTRSGSLLTHVRTEADPRHVLVFSHGLHLGGGQLWLQELLNGLVKQHGWRVTVVTPVDGPLRQDCADLGIDVHLTRPYQVDTVAAYEGHVAELALIAKTSGASVALVNTITAFPGVDAAKRAGLPVTWAVHESFPLGTFAYETWRAGLNPTVRARWEELFREADQLTFVADATREMYERYSPAHRGRTIRYGTPMVRFDGRTSGRVRHDARERLGLPPDALVVLNVGIMEPRKGQAGLIAAMDRVRRRHPEVLLTVVGYHESQYGLATAELVRRMGLGDWVNLVEVQRDPVPWFQAADLFVNSSDLESLPRSILEAVCVGLPVVASDVFGAREIVADGRTGWLFEPNDVDALTVALLRALETPPRERAEIAARAFAELSGWLDPAGYAAEYSQVLESLGDQDG